MADHRSVIGHCAFFDAADKPGVQFLDRPRRREAAGVVLSSFGMKDFALRFVRWGRCPMTIDDYIVSSILIVIVLWVLVKMRPRGKS